MTAGTPGVPGHDGVPPSPLARIRAAVEEAERRSRAQEARDAERTAQLAAAARRGELGPEWRTVQTRVDRGETTLADVFTGRDTSPAAAALARRSRENVAALAATARDDEDVADAVEELDAIRARVSAELGDRAAARSETGPGSPHDGSAPAAAQPDGGTP